MTNVVLVLVTLLVGWYIVSFVRRHRRGLVAERGMSIGADLGALADQPVVRVRAVTQEGPDRVRITLTPQAGPDDGPGHSPDLELEFVVFLREEEFGFGLLQEWERSESPIAIVMPRGGRIVRLRSTTDLQPLTLRRVDEE